LAVDTDKPSSEEDLRTRGSLLGKSGLMAVAILLIAGGIWVAGKYLLPPTDKPDIIQNPGSAPGTENPGEQPEENPQPPPDPAAKATVVLQEGSGELDLPPSAAVLTGTPRLKIAISENVLCGWTSADDAATWKFKLQRPGFFKLELAYAAAHEGKEIELELLLGDETLHRFHLASTGGEDQFQTVSHIIVVKASGTRALTIRPTAAIPKESLTIKSVRLIPVGGQQ
jgi:hypothetical protein